MPKDTFYFSHDYNARNDEKILELRSEYGAEGYGIFWMIVETMAENENGGVKATLIGGLSHGYGVAKDKLISIISLCKKLELFYEEDGYLFSKRLLSHKYIRKNLSEAGKSGANKRWGGYSHPNSTPNGKTMPKERKGKENKEVGVKFDADGKNVIFEDGSIQPLGHYQLMRMKDKSYKPHYIQKGKIE